MLTDIDSGRMRITDLAMEAHVGIQTIYYHFGSISRLIAESQAHAYFLLTEPLRECLLRAETAVIARNETAFWNAIRDDLMLAWSIGSGDDSWRLCRLLLDVWTDVDTRRTFSGLLDVQLERWVHLIDESKELGWISEGLNAHSLVAAYWSASNGQAILSFSSNFSYSPQNVQDLFLRISRQQNSVTGTDIG
jgi:AcrR family transcriptional regulator